MLASLPLLKLLVLQRPGRISKVQDSGICTASPEHSQSQEGVSVTAVFVLAEVGAKSQAGQGWGRGKRQEWIY